MAKYIIDGTLVITSETWAPIPIRNMDWEAVTDNYEPGDPVGHGATEQEAIADLLEQLEDAPEAYDPDRAYEDARDEREYERLYGYPCMGDE